MCGITARRHIVKLYGNAVLVLQPLPHVRSYYHTPLIDGALPPIQLSNGFVTAGHNFHNVLHKEPYFRCKSNISSSSKRQRQCQSQKRSRLSFVQRMLHWALHTAQPTNRELWFWAVLHKLWCRDHCCQINIPEFAFMTQSFDKFPLPCLLCCSGKVLASHTGVRTFKSQRRQIIFLKRWQLSAIISTQWKVHHKQL